MKIARELFGRIKDTNVDVHIYTLENQNGMKVRITEYGCVVTELRVPDRRGRIENVVLGLDTLEQYLSDVNYLGAIVGRCTNRISGARFELDGREYTLTANLGEDHLHGGLRGFSRVLWQATPRINAGSAALTLTYLSPDGEEGYPGNLDCSVEYRLTNNNELVIEYKATTNKPTLVNLTHHGYFNLSADFKKDIHDHQLWINADHFTPIDERLMPTGEFRSVEGTPFDFRERTRIGLRINEPNQQLRFGNGYDHNFVLNDADGTLRKQATLYDPGSGRLMELLTTEPGLQLYTGNFLNGGRGSETEEGFGDRCGLCLETQHFPDAPNRPEFPSIVLRPDAAYQSQTVLRFTTDQHELHKKGGST